MALKMKNFGPLNQALYKKPLYEVREIRDLRDMIRQSADLYGEHHAYLVKDPIALREFKPRSPEHQTFKVDHQRPYKGISFRQYYRDVRSFGTALLAGNDPVGSRVAILAETRYEWYVSYLTTVNGYGIVVPLDKEQPQEELQSLLDRSESRVLIYSGSKASAVEAIRDKLQTVKTFICMDLPREGSGDLYFWDLIEKGAAILDSGENAYDNLPLDPEAMSILLFTSGTTARSKGVMLSHKNICTNLMAMCSMVYIGPEDTFLSVLPLHHTYECTCGYLCQLYRGSTVAVCEGLRYIAQNMKECKATIVLMVPLMVEAIHSRIMKSAKANPAMARKFNFAIHLTRALRKIGIDLRKKLFAKVHDSFGGKLHLVIAGGAAIAPELIRDIQDLGIHCIQGYGLTECAPILALNRDTQYNNKSAGLPMPGVDIKVINPDENGIGEFAGRGDNVMLGYYDNEELTREAIDPDGYYHTGDLGYIDSEGFVIITGRKSNLIVTPNGKNIFPEELEFLIAQDERVQECVIYAEETADDKIVCCQIYPNFDALTDVEGKRLERHEIESRLRALVQEINGRLAPYKRVRKVTFRDIEFLKTTSRKIRRSSVIR